MTVETQRSADVILRLSATQRAFVEDEHRYTAMLGGVGAGKSYAGAVKALSRFGTGRPALGLVVSPTYPMLRDATWRTALDVWAPLLSRVVQNEMRVKLVTGDEVLFRSADEPDRLRGPNASWAWIDEAALCHPDTWDVVIGRLRQFGEVGSAWVTTTPKGMNWLYERFVVDATDEMAIHRAATWANPFVDPAFTTTLRSQYSGDFARQEIEAEFIADTEGSLLEYAWLDAASRPADPYTPGVDVQAGVDVAGPGDAETVLCLRQGGSILSVQAFSQADARGAVVAELRPWQDRGLSAVNVDTAGIGHYFAEALVDAGLPVVRINVGEAPQARGKAAREKARARYANLRAQVFWSFREWAEQGMLSGLADRTALGQLASIRYDHDNRGRIAIEKKDDARSRGVRSPDRAEAIVLAFWSHPRSSLGQAMQQALTGSSALRSAVPLPTQRQHQSVAEDAAFKKLLERVGADAQ